MSDASKPTFNDIISGEKPVLVDFWADWCQPCHMLAPILQETANEMGDKLKIVKINVDKNQELSAHYGIRSIPTMILFKDGKETWRQSGVVPKEMLVKELGAHV